MLTWYLLLLFLPFVLSLPPWKRLHKPHFWGSKYNVGRLRSQRRTTFKRKPLCGYGCTDDNFFCKSDFSGYSKFADRVCNAVKCGDEFAFKACPTGTRCGCMLVCHASVVDPCIPIVEPYPMQEKATFIFNGYTAKVWTGIADHLQYSKENRGFVSPPTKGKVTGMVRQDVKEGKFLQVITKQKVRNHFGLGIHSFTLIVPNDADGTFIKYVGFRPEGRCKRTVLEKFDPFGSGVKDFLLNETRVGEDGNLIQTWKYEYSAELMSEVNYRWKWVIEADDTTLTSRPLSTSYYDDRAFDDDYYPYANTQHVTWETRDLDVDWIEEVKWYADLWNEKGDWFRIPPMCL